MWTRGEGQVRGWGAEEWLFGIRPQNMVVSYLVLTGRLLESRWSKSQVVLPRECISASISRGSICRSLGVGRSWGGGRKEGRKEGMRRAAVGSRRTTLTRSSAHIRAMWIRRRSPVIASESQTHHKSQSTAWMMSDTEYGQLQMGAADPPLLVIQRQHVFHNGQMDATLTCKHWRHTCCTDCLDVTDIFLEGNERKILKRQTHNLTLRPYMPSLAPHTVICIEHKSQPH